MIQQSIPAVFMRGGTSKGLMLHRRDLPAAREEWGPLLTGAMGSPDPYGRQLDGMGGGVSSTSKVCVIGASAREDADVDYTFCQVPVTGSAVQYQGNCGNMSSAVGPFAVDEKLLDVAGETATVRIFNTNTQKLIRSTFPVGDGRARYDGDLAIPGVAGTGAPIRLDFIAPGGASTGRLLPSGRLLDTLDVPGFGALCVSLVDAANAAVFVRARDVGLSGAELPGELEARADVLALLEAVRVRASVAMGIAPDIESAGRITIIPFVAVIAPPADSRTLAGDGIGRDEVDLTARVISNGQPHRALPLTISLCAAVAARMPGTVVAEALPPGAPAGALRLGMPSGILTVDADVAEEGGTWVARAGSFYRTARRLFDGRVHLPARRA